MGNDIKNVLFITIFPISSAGKKLDYYLNTLSILIAAHFQCRERVRNYLR